MILLKSERRNKSVIDFQKYHMAQCENNLLPYERPIAVSFMSHPYSHGKRYDAGNYIYDCIYLEFQVAENHYSLHHAECMYYYCQTDYTHDICKLWAYHKSLPVVGRRNIESHKGENSLQDYSRTGWNNQCGIPLSCVIEPRPSRSRPSSEKRQ